MFSIACERKYCVSGEEACVGAEEAEAWLGEAKAE